MGIHGNVFKIKHTKYCVCGKKINKYKCSIVKIIYKIHMKLAIQQVNEETTKAY